MLFLFLPFLPTSGVRRRMIWVAWAAASGRLGPAVTAVTFIVASVATLTASSADEARTLTHPPSACRDPQIIGHDDFADSWGYGCGGVG